MYGQGTFTQTGGTHLISGSLTLGLFPFFGKGVYTLAGDGVLTANEVNVTIGRFEWFGGTLTAQSLGVGGLGTLALGFDVDMNALCSGQSLPRFRAGHFFRDVGDHPWGYGDADRRNFFDFLFGYRLEQQISPLGRNDRHPGRFFK